MWTVHRTLINPAHTAQYSLFTSAERIARAVAQELQRHLCALEKNLSSGPHVSHPLVSHLPCTTSTSSSAFTLPSTTTPEHALQSGQHDLLLEHTVHHQPLQDLQSKSNAIKNHSVLELNRVAETRAKHSPQVMSPKSLRPSQGSRG